MTLTPPPRKHLIKEARAAREFAHMAVRLLHPSSHRIQTEPVMLLPGFGASDRAMMPMLHMLRRHAVHAEGWNLGRNLAGLNLKHSLDDLPSSWAIDPIAEYRGEAGFAYLSNLLIERVQQRSKELKSKLTLIGWSLGGSLAREAARETPVHVKQIITLGSPVVGGPKYTAAGQRLKNQGIDVDWIEKQMQRREERPIEVPITAIVSPSDGIVGYRAARDVYSPNVRHIDMNVSHLGMPLNPKVWDVVLDSIQAHH
ncbi:MAG: hypothetical protein AAGH65_12280 [Pseudomonadota bacterium]